MDRREFLNLSGGAAAALAVPIEVRPEEERLARYLRASASRVPDEPRSYGVTITSEFMEDYTAGTPWVPAMKIEIPYVSKDGTAQIFSFSGAWSGGSGDATLDRILPDPDPEKHPDQTTLTGWAVQRTVMPPEPFGGAIFAPQAIIVPGTPDRLLIYRRYSLLIASLADDGVVGRFIVVGKNASLALVTGQLPPSSLYVLENGILDNRNSAEQNFNGPVLRDLTTLKAIPIDSKNFPTMTETFKFRRLYPLKGVAAGIYRCVVQDESNVVLYLTLALDSSDAAKPVFRVHENLILGASSNGCVAVHEPLAGICQVTYFDFPGLRQIEIRYQTSAPYLLGQSLPAGKMYSPTPDDGPGQLAPSYPAGTTLETRSLWNGDTNSPETFVLIKRPDDQLTELWSLSRLPNGRWEPLSLVDKGLRDVAIFDAKEVTLLISKPRTGFEIWVRNKAGDWVAEHVRVQDEGGKMREVAGYRVGITMQADGLPAGGEQIGVTASVSTSAVIQQTHCALGIHRPFQAETDSTGTLWVTVLLEDRISFPSLIINSPRFEHQLVMDLNHKIENFMTEVTPEKIMAARDPRRCTDLSPDGCTGDEIGKGLTTGDEKPHPTDLEKAKKSADLIQRTMSAAPKSALLERSVESVVALRSDLPAAWIPSHMDATTLRTPGAAHLAPAWIMTRRDGVPHIELVSHQEAAAHMARMTANHPPYSMGFFDFVTDAIDAIGNLAKSVYETVCDVVEAVADGLKIAITFVVDNFRFVYEAVMETIEQVMDAIEFFLDYAGMALGMAVGWLLEQLGFLFDWKAIKARRDKFRTMIRDNAKKSLNSVYKDPRVSVVTLRKTITSAKAEIHTALDQFRSSPSDKRTIASDMKDEPDGPDASFVNGAAILPHVSWLLDKLQPSIVRIRGGMNQLNVANFGALVTDLATKLGALTLSLGPTSSDVMALVNSWVLHGDLFSSSVFDPVIDLIEAHIDAFLDALIGVLQAGANLLGAFWDSPEKIVDWLDSPIQIPFFSGFYRGLMGNPLSFFDVSCLLAAIPAALSRDETTLAMHTVPPRLNFAPAHAALERTHSDWLQRYQWDGAGGAHLEREALIRRGRPRTALASGVSGGGVGTSLFNSELGQACAAFSIAICIMQPISTAITALSDPYSQGAIVNGLSGILIAMNASWSVLDIYLEGAGWEKNVTSAIVYTSASLALLAITGIGGYLGPFAQSLVNYLKKRVDAVLMALLLLNFVRAIIDAGTENVAGLIAMVCTIDEGMINLAIRQRETMMSPQSAIMMGVLVGVLEGAKTAAYLERPGS